MNHQPQGESIWGNINTVIEIALNVYYIVAENGEGIMIPKDNAKDTISEKAISAGKENKDYLCYGKDETMDIPMYEVLQKRIAACDKIKAEALAQVEEIQRDGHLRLTDYFGECEPPKDTPDGNADQLQKVRNGIYFTETDGITYFAVQEAVADNFLSPLAYEFGKKKGDYLYYDLTTSAVPLHELRQIYSEVNDLVVSEDSLYATLGKNFQAYVTAYNDIVAEESKIPPVEAPTILFLQRQLDEPQRETESPVLAPEQEQDNYSEQVEDYGFEQ